MLGQGDNHGVGFGESDKGKLLAEFLALRGMHAAVIAVQPLLADGFYVLADGLVVDL